MIDLQDELHDLFDDPAPQAVQRPSDPMATFAPAATTDAPEASSVLMWLGLAAVGAYGAKKRLRAA